MSRPVERATIIDVNFLNSREYFLEGLQKYSDCDIEAGM
jgi:hypothetical protein